VSRDHSATIEKLSALAEYEELKRKKSVSAHKESEITKTPELIKKNFGRAETSSGASNN